MDAQEQRRLLELAAKAAGMKARYFADHWPGLKVFGDPRPWNPIDDDGDSRRLEVALRLSVIHSIDGAVMVMSPDISVSVTESAGGDQDATTRLAVLRAAAAIGERMEARP